MADIEFRDITDDGRLRHASLKGQAQGMAPEDPP
jgi:hypothetical protein